MLLTVHLPCIEMTQRCHFCLSLLFIYFTLECLGSWHILVNTTYTVNVTVEPLVIELSGVLSVVIVLVF